MTDPLFSSKRGLYVLTALGIGFALAFIVFFIHRGATDYQTATEFIGNIQMNTIEQFQNTFGLTIYSELALYYAVSQGIHMSAQEGGRGLSTIECKMYHGKTVWNAPEKDCTPTPDTMAQGIQEYAKSSLHYYFSRYRDIVIPLYALSGPTLESVGQTLVSEAHFRQPISFPIMIDDDMTFTEVYKDPSLFHQTVDLYRVGDLVWPLRTSVLDNFVITSLFGNRTIAESPYTEHQGVDVRSRAGEPVYAIAQGIVEESTHWDDTGSLGKIRLSHDNGLESRYLHCMDILVNESDVVEQGQPLCFIGGAGRGSLDEFAPHLHLEIRKDGVIQDPLLYYLPLDLYFTQAVLFQMDSNQQTYSYEETIRRNII